MMGGVLRWAVQNAPADLCRKVGLFANQSCAQNPEKTPGLLEDHEAVELAAADVHEAVVLDERERPVRVRRMSFLKITSS